MTASVADLKRLQADPKLFQESLRVDCDGEVVRLGDRLDPWQRADFASLDAAWRAAVGQKVEPGQRRGWFERPRGHSKTSDLAVALMWVLFASRRQVRGIAAAGDRDQAKLLRDAIDRLVRLYRWLPLEVTNWKVTNPHTGATLEVVSSDAATSFGHLVNFIACDELTHWPNDGMWTSMLSTAAKRRDCVLVVIANAGHTDHWSWPVREATRVDPAWVFSRQPGPVASWIDDDRLAEQRRLLPEIAFRTLDERVGFG